jgi:hypothetical protein
MWLNNGPWYRSSSRLIERENKKRKGFQKYFNKSVVTILRGPVAFIDPSSATHSCFLRAFYSVLVCWGFRCCWFTFFFLFSNAANAHVMKTIELRMKGDGRETKKMGVEPRLTHNFLRGTASLYPAFAFFFSWWQSYIVGSGLIFPTFVGVLCKCVWGEKQEEGSSVNIIPPLLSRLGELFTAHRSRRQRIERMCRWHTRVGG